MVMFSIVALGMAIATFYLSHHLRDDVMHLSLFLGAIASLLLSFIFTPWVVKLPILLFLLAMLERIQGNEPI